jgi:hypothetical protein
MRRPKPTRAVEPWKKKKKKRITLVKLVAEDKLLGDGSPVTDSSHYAV